MSVFLTAASLDPTYSTLLSALAAGYYRSVSYPLASFISGKINFSGSAGPPALQKTNTIFLTKEGRPLSPSYVSFKILPREE